MDKDGKDKQNYFHDISYTSKKESFLWRFINFLRRNKNIFLIAKSIRLLAKNGPIEILKLFAINKKGHRVPLKKEIYISIEEREKQEKTEFPVKIKISIIVVLQNSNEQFLKMTIDSVIKQTYSNWELYLAHGYDNNSYTENKIRQFCLSYAEQDNRIKYSEIQNTEKAFIANYALPQTTGDYIGILDHNDLLHPASLFEIMNVICNEKSDFIYTDEAIFYKNKIRLKHYKPDYAIDTLHSTNYINHLCIFSKELYKKCGNFNENIGNSYDYEFILRYTRMSSKVYHIPKILYFNRSYRKKVKIKNKKNDFGISGINAIELSIKERNLKGRAENKPGLPGFYRIHYEIKGNPLVSIIIPNKDNITLLKNCLDTLISKTTYSNYEIIIVENNSVDKETFLYYEELKNKNNITVVNWQKKGFNYSEICNYGADFAKGSQLLFLNNDILIINPEWIEEMLMYSQRDDVGIVGAKLYFLNGAIQHAGIILGLGGEAGHIFLGTSYTEIGYMAKLHIVQNMSAVTGACMMIKKSVFIEIGQYAPKLYESFNDVDLCLKAIKKGYLVVWTPYAEAYHLESKSRGYLAFSKKKSIFSKESSFFNEKWGTYIKAGDPYYNPNFSLEKTDYSL